MRDKKIIIDGLTTQDFEVMETNFSNMAKKGLLIEKIKFGVSFYKKIQPKDMEFAIGIYPKPKAYEKPEEQVVAKYIEEQEEKGWKHLFSQDHTHVFINESGEELQGIDKIEQVENMKSTLKLEIVSFTILTLLNIYNMTQMSGIGIYNLSSNLGLIGVFIMPVLIIAIGSHLIYDIFRYIRIDKKTSDDIQIKNIIWIKIFRKTSFLFGTFLAGLFIAAIAADSFISGTRVIFMFLPVLVSFFVVFKLRGYFTGKNFNAVGKTLMAFFTVFGILAVSLLIGFQTLLYDLDEELPEKYIALRLEDIGYKQDVKEVSFDKEGSILMPLSYSYRETIDLEWPDSLYVYTDVQKGLNKSIADYIFQLKVKNTRFFGQLVSAKEFYPNYDKAYFLERDNGEIEDVKLQKGEYIFMFSGVLDLKEDKTIELVNQTVDKIITDFN